MFRYALKSLRAHLTRLISTAVAVVVGIGFLAAGLMVTDAVRAGLTGDIERRYAEVDLAVITATRIDTGLDLERLPGDTLDTVRGTEGVAAAAGEAQSDIRVLGPDGRVVDLRTQGRVWIEDEQLNPLDLVEGSPPSGDAVALDAGLATEAGVGPGDEVTLRTPVGELTVPVAGISRFGSSDALDPGGTVSFSEDVATDILNAGNPGYSTVLVRVSEDPEVVRSALESSLGAVAVVQSGPEFIETASDEASEILDFLRPALQGFAYLSLFVASFVIFNTFSVVVTQRSRELALVRAVGGTPGQVRRSLLAEGLGIGLGSSVAGIVAGGLFALALQVVLGWFDIALPGSGIKLTLGTVAVCLVVGTLVTVVSVLIPAVRAGRTKPVEAMRSAAVDVSGTSKVRALIGAAFLLLGIALLTINELVTSSWWFVGIGALLLFLGVIVGGPLLARLFAKLLTRPLDRLGVAGRLAADNSVRNPKRTATTANALVIGLFLVTIVTVAGEALKTTAVNELNELSGSDFLVTSMTGLDADLIEAIDETDGVTATAPVRSGFTVDAGGSPVAISTSDFDALRTTAGVTVGDGSLEGVEHGEGVAVADLGGIFAGNGDDEDGATTPDLGFSSVGDTISARDTSGEMRYLRVEASLEAKLDSLVLGYLVGEQTFVDLVGEQPVSTVFVRIEPGEGAAVGERLEGLIESYTAVEVLAGNFIGETVREVFDFLIGAVNGLLGMSVVIALVGIVNTMTLSIFERRRELGLVRALGMTRQQVARMVRLEAVLIGLLGTVIGVASGVLIGWIVVSNLDEAIGLSFNWLRVGLIFVVGVGVGVMAAILPTRRATRTDMLEAINSP